MARKSDLNDILEPVENLLPPVEALPGFQGSAPFPVRTEIAGEVLSVPVGTPAREEATQEYEIVHKIDPATNRWVEERVSLETANVITAAQMTDYSMTGHGAEVLNTEGYGPGMVRYWASRDTNHISTIDAWAKGYRPVDMRGNSSPHNHNQEKIAGWGDKPVVSRGDLVLMEIPAHIYQAQQEAERRQNLARRRDSSDPALAGQRILGEAGLSYDEKSAVVMQDKYGRVMTSYTQDIGSSSMGDDRAEVLAGSMQRAMAYREQEDHAASGSQTFGGFRGPMGGGVPDSRLNIAGRPMLR